MPLPPMLDETLAGSSGFGNPALHYAAGYSFRKNGAARARSADAVPA